MKLTSGAVTDTGMVREINEDSFGVFEDVGLYIVADGMGGHAAGEVASKMAVETVGEIVRKDVLGKSSGTKTIDPEVGAGLLKGAVTEANTRIFAHQEKNESAAGMGTTLVSMLSLDDCFVIAHVGDSRLYQIRSGQTLQVTEDHSLVAEQLRMKLITEEEALTHKYRNVVTRSLGPMNEVEVDLKVVQPCDGDIFLLCSDGLSGLVQAEDLAEIVIEDGDLDAICEQLVKLANDRGGNDNITVVLVRVEEGGLSPDASRSDTLILKNDDVSGTEDTAGAEDLFSTDPDGGGGSGVLLQLILCICISVVVLGLYSHNRQAFVPTIKPPPEDQPISDAGDLTAETSEAKGDVSVVEDLPVSTRALRKTKELYGRYNWFCMKGGLYYPERVLALKANMEKLASLLNDGDFDGGLAWCDEIETEINDLAEAYAEFQGPEVTANLSRQFYSYDSVLEHIPESSVPRYMSFAAEVFVSRERREAEEARAKLLEEDENASIVVATNESGETTYHVVSSYFAHEEYAHNVARSLAYGTGKTFRTLAIVQGRLCAAEMRVLLGVFDETENAEALLNKIKDVCVAQVFEHTLPKGDTAKLLVSDPINPAGFPDDAIRQLERDTGLPATYTIPRFLGLD
ncbi:Stp1/IreP family PP2C-type Ser/Thr phosphatase [Candidatus Hydrogenedentota bacterium]